MPPDPAAGCDGQGKVKHEPGLAALGLAAKEDHALVQQAIDNSLGGSSLVNQEVVAVFRFALGLPGEADRLAARPSQFLRQPRTAFLARQL